LQKQYFVESCEAAATVAPSVGISQEDRPAERKSSCWCRM